MARRAAPRSPRFGALDVMSRHHTSGFARRHFARERRAAIHRSRYFLKISSMSRPPRRMPAATRVEAPMMASLLPLRRSLAAVAQVNTGQCPAPADSSMTGAPPCVMTPPLRDAESMAACTHIPGRPSEAAMRWRRRARPSNMGRRRPSTNKYRRATCRASFIASLTHNMPPT